MDVNMLNVAKLIFNDVSSRFFHETPITAEEIELKDRIIEVIESYVKSTPVFTKYEQDFEVCHPSEMEREEENPNESGDEESFGGTSGRSSPDYDSPNPEGKQRVEIPIEDKRRVVEYWESGKKGRLHWRTVAGAFRFVKSSRQLYRFKRQLDQRDLKEDKMRILWNYTLDKLKSAKERNVSFDDGDLRRWALEKNFEVRLDTFKASKSWIQKLKRSYEIGSVVKDETSSRPDADGSALCESVETEDVVVV